MTKGKALVLVENDATVKGNCGNINVPAVELSVYVSDNPEVLQVAVKLKVDNEFSCVCIHC